MISSQNHFYLKEKSWLRAFNSTEPIFQFTQWLENGKCSPRNRIQLSFSHIICFDKLFNKFEKINCKQEIFLIFKTFLNEKKKPWKSSKTIFFDNFRKKKLSFNFFIVNIKIWKIKKWGVKAWKFRYFSVDFQMKVRNRILILFQYFFKNLKLVALG